MSRPDGEEGRDGPEGPGVRDPELRRMLGLFDLPAFARRGLEIESFPVRLRARCAAERDGMLDMVRLRLRQWAAGSGPNGWVDVFRAPIEPLWDLTAEPPPTWATLPLGAFRRRGLGRDLKASVERFNRRWLGFLETLRFDTYNNQVDQYNRYYVLEKEIALGSARLAARHFSPKAPLGRADVLAWYPLLPEPELLG